MQQVDLDAQFRCGGSRLYEEWVLSLLSLGGKQPVAWAGDEHFDVSVTESPYELEAVLRDRLDAGYSARMTAGFCWRWSNPDGDRLIPDVVIGDWARPWNAKGDRSVGSAPPSALWATLDGGFDQVGCVYTAQGFEYDWNGVIVGPDLIYRDGQLVTVRSASKDPALVRGGVNEAQADQLIRNTYTVITEAGPVEISVPRDRDSSFEPKIVAKRQRRLTGVEEMVISLSAKGLTDGEIAAQLQEIYRAEVSKQTITAITDRVMDGMAEWQSRQLDPARAVVFIDAINLTDPSAIAHRLPNFFSGTAKRNGVPGVLGATYASGEPAGRRLCRLEHQAARSGCALACS